MGRRWIYYNLETESKEILDIKEEISVKDMT